MQEPVIQSGHKAAICNPVTVGVVVLIVHLHITSASHGESVPAIFRSGRWRRNVLADDILAFRRWIDFHDRSAIRVSVGANLVHPTLQISALHGGPRETHFVDRGELFWRDRIKSVRKVRGGNTTENS